MVSSSFYPAPLPENSRLGQPSWQPLPGSAVFLRQQAELDGATLVQVAAYLRQTVREIMPLLDTLYFKAAPLAVLECCSTLEALAQEVEQDDVQTVAERVLEQVRAL